MVMQGNQKKRVVWQDVRPASQLQKPVAKKVSVIQKIKLTFLRLFKFPLYKKVASKIPQTSRRTKIVTGATLIVLVALASGYFVFINHSTKTSNVSNDTKTTTTKPVLTHGLPGYSTILPTNKNINDLGGWTRISPPKSDPVYAYTDKIGKVSIIVSQQLLPDNFKSNTTYQIEQLALSFNATEKITVGGITVYIGTSAEGPQSVIFSKNNLLILIKSDSKIDNDQWAKYVNSLR